MQWRQAIGVAVVLGAVAGRTPLAAQTAIFLTAIPAAAQSNDTSWAAFRQQITHRFQQDLGEIATTGLLEQEPTSLQVSMSVTGTALAMFTFELQAVTEPRKAKSCIKIPRSPRT